MPINIELSEKTRNVLFKTLLASNPEEGCAILIGREKSSAATNQIQLEIIHIWPCCNTWEPNFFSNYEIKDTSDGEKISNLSKRNRFAIDPKEQILAQKWARSKKLKILGIAHSHPSSDGIPSKHDLIFHKNLMVIIDQSAKIYAWWIKYNQAFKEVEVVLQN